MKLTVIAILIGAFGEVTKRLIQGLDDLEIRGQVDTIQTTALFRLARTLKESRKLEETCFHSDSSDKPSANAGVKISQKCTHN